MNFFLAGVAVIIAKTFSSALTVALLVMLNASSLSAAPSSKNEEPTLDQMSVSFFGKTTVFSKSSECLPLQMDQNKSVNILYLFCSETASIADADARTITSDFIVTPGIARRFNFWRRVYSLWTEDDYVLHSAEYPEVVFEIANVAVMDQKISDAEKTKRVNSVLNQHRELYRSVLVRMNSIKNQPEKMTPVMVRIAAMMSHINDPQKYVKAAENLRVQRGQRNQIGQGLTTATRYMGAVEKAFTEEGLPAELARIAFIESSFNLKARSKVGASGIYQIMPSTGREFMIVTDQIDERNDPIKAAHAAARLLRQNYEVAGAWSLAITGYNHGINGVRRAVREVGSSNIEDLIAKYDGPAFGFASKNFYCGFLALLATVAQADALFPNVARLDPISYQDYLVTRPVDISTLKRRLGITNEQIMDLNPDIHRFFILANGRLPKGYKLKIPTSVEIPVHSSASVRQVTATEKLASTP